MFLTAKGANMPNKVTEEEIKKATENIWANKEDHAELIKNCVEFAVRHWKRSEINLYL